MATNINELPEEQQGQHRAVLKVAGQNLNTVIDSLQTLDSALYDEILDNLDTAREVLEHKQEILNRLKNG